MIENLLPSRPAPTLTGDRPHAWQDDALCAQTEPELFHPEKGGSTHDAKRICASCPVINDCLNYALANDIRSGIWGGKSVQERRLLRAVPA